MRYRHVNKTCGSTYTPSELAVCAEADRWIDRGQEIHTNQPALAALLRKEIARRGSSATVVLDEDEDMV